VEIVVNDWIRPTTFSWTTKIKETARVQWGDDVGEWERIFNILR
jgi:hypothetical protein